MPEEEPEEAAAEEPEEEAEEEPAEEPEEEAEEEPAEEPEEEEPTEAPTPTVAPTEVPAETEIPVGEMINRVGRTNKSVRFREQKSTKSGIIKTFQSNEYVYMIREELDAEGTRWTMAQDHGQFGYVMSEFLDQLPQWESDRIMSEAFATPVPYVSQELADSIGATPTPVPEPVVTAEPENEALTMAAVPEEEAAEEAPAEEDEAAEETEAPAETETPTPEPTETPEPTPAETEIPAGEMINRFGTTNAKDVRFRAEPSTSIGEVRRTRAPAVLLELGFHDNPQDAAWIVNNIEAIAANLVRSLTVYFGIPFFPASSPRTGVVETGGGPLNVRVRPDPDSPVIARLYDGARVTVVNAWEGWDLVRFGEEAGYAAAAFIR